MLYLKMTWAYIVQSIRLVEEHRKVMFWFSVGLYGTILAVNAARGEWGEVLTGAIIAFILFGYLSASVRNQILLKALGEVNREAWTWDRVANGLKDTSIVGAAFRSCSMTARSLTSDALTEVSGTEFLRLIEESIEDKEEEESNRDV